MTVVSSTTRDAVTAPMIGLRMLGAPASLSLVDPSQNEDTFGRHR
jgi:hypothetical protein